jgi:hypothetical protein
LPHKANSVRPISLSFLSQLKHVMALVMLNPKDDFPGGMYVHGVPQKEQVRFIGRTSGRPECARFLEVRGRHASI